MNRRHALHLVVPIVAVAALPALALSDPKPEPALAALLGEWRGTLTYRDYSRPDRMETLPTKLFVSAIAPDEIALHYVYDDGPGKTVYGYERMRFEFASNTLLWISGAVEKTALVGRITDSGGDGPTKRFVVETTKDRTLSRYTFEFGTKTLTMKKEEIDAAGKAVMRNLYSFSRG